MQSASTTRPCRAQRSRLPESRPTVPQPDRARRHPPGQGGWLPLQPRALGTIDVTCFNMAASQKFCNVRRNGQAALVVDDIGLADPWRVHLLEIRGTADAITAPADPRARTTRRRSESIARGSSASASKSPRTNPPDLAHDPEHSLSHDDPQQPAPHQARHSQARTAGGGDTDHRTWPKRGGSPRSSPPISIQRHSAALCTRPF
jgi:PPOX class F420-dependent enzyme/OxyR family protein